MIRFSKVSFKASLYYLLLFIPFFICFQAIADEHGKRLPATQNPYEINNKKYYPVPTAEGYSETGIASWYGDDFHGRPTSNGEIYDMYKPTAAHKILPMNTMLLVSNLDNGKETIVRINDRGPFVQGRIIDLSYGAAQKLNILQKGTARVRVTALAPMSGKNASKDITNYLFDNGEYYVQIGSFSSKSNALKLQRRFTEAGHTTVIQKFFNPKATYYRVQVYVGTHLTGALTAEKALHKNGYHGAFIIAR